MLGLYIQLVIAPLGTLAEGFVLPQLPRQQEANRLTEQRGKDNEPSTNIR